MHTNLCKHKYGYIACAATIDATSDALEEAVSYPSLRVCMHAHI